MKITVKYLGATNKLPSRLRANLVTHNKERAQMTQSVSSLEDESGNMRISKELPAQYLAEKLLDTYGVNYHRLDCVHSAKDYVFNVIVCKEAA